MEMCDIDESIRAWLQRPLCRRHGAAVFSTARARGRGTHADQPLAICWGLGTLINGEAEVLGAWLSVDRDVAVPPAVFSDLLARGVEFIRYGVGDLLGAEEAFCQTFRQAEVVPSIAQALESVAALVPPRHRGAVSDSLRAAAEAVDLGAARTALARFQRTGLGERYPTVVALCGEALARSEPFFALPAPLRQLVRSADRTALDVRERLTRAIHRHGPFIDPAAALDFVADRLLRAEHRLDRERAASWPAGEGLGPSRRSGPMRGALGVPALA